MPEGDDTGTTGGTTSTTTFTQADIDRIVRERVKRERDKFADYDELRTKAGEADKSKSALDQLLEKFTAMEKRTAESEARALRLEVAQAKKLPAWMAKRLTGTTKEELEADADEMLAEWKPAAKDDGDGKDGTDGKAGGGNDGDGKDGAGKETGSVSTKDTSGSGEGGERKLPPSGRPKEKLTSGATSASSGEKSAAEMAEEILKSDF